MLLPPPPLRPRRNRKRAKAPVPVAVPPGLTITSVVPQTPAEEVKIFFAGPIVWDGVTTPSNFKAFTGDGFLDSPIDVLAVGPDWIEVEFNAGVAAGAAWELQGAMEGFTPAVAWPQAGVAG